MGIRVIRPSPNLRGYREKGAHFVGKEHSMADPVTGLPRAGPEEAARTHALRAQVCRLRGGPAGEEQGVDLRPANAYEAVTRQMVEDIAAELREIKGRLNNLLFMIAAAVLLDVVARMLGG